MRENTRGGCSWGDLRGSLQFVHQCSVEEEPCFLVFWQVLDVSLSLVVAGDFSVLCRWPLCPLNASAVGDVRVLHMPDCLFWDICVFLAHRAVWFGSVTK